MMQADFTGKVAVVTGGSGALCSEFCKALARSGAKVAVVGSRKETADGIAAEIIADGGEAIAVGCNVLDMDSVLAAEQVIRKAYGQYQILINGAGIAPAAACTTRERASMELLDASTTQENTLFNLDTEAVASVLDLNCLGIFNVTKVFAKRMAGVEGACIVNIASMSGLSPLTKQIAYSASGLLLTWLTSASVSMPLHQVSSPPKSIAVSSSTRTEAIPSVPRKLLAAHRWTASGSPRNSLVPCSICAIIPPAAL